MESFGLLGVVPPLLAVILALFTKDAITALFVGVISGLLIISGGDIFASLISFSNLLAKILSDSWNVRIFLFCAMLGGFVGLMAYTGAAHAFGIWATKKLKTQRSSQFATFIFGLIIFIDDYFSALATGSIMRPISDKTGTPRAKLAYNVHSTTASVCVIAPVSSWVVTIMSISKSSDGFEKLGLTPLEFFIALVPYNLYAFAVLLVVLGFIISGVDFGAMKKAMLRAKNEGALYDEKRYGIVANASEHVVNKNAKAIDMLLPIAVLICTALVFFPLTTYLMAIENKEAATLAEAFGATSLSDAFKNTDASVALLHAIIFTFFATYIYYFLRGLVRVGEASEAILKGVGSMVSALMILCLAWMIGAIIKSSPADGGLGLGAFLSQIVVAGDFPLFALAMIVFLVSGLISFATGTSWGTFGIMIPLVMPIVTALASSNGLDLEGMQNATFITIAAVIGGAVFGDNTSPISDSTILSATGASCPVLEHIATQMPYAVFTALCALLGFLVAGVTQNILLGWGVMLTSIVLGIVFLPKIYRG